VVVRAACASGQAITEFPIPTAESRPCSITTGPDGNLWFTESTLLQSPRTGRVARIEPFEPNTITEFPLPRVEVFPTAITPGPDGNLWFTTYSSVAVPSIGRIMPGSPNTIRPWGDVVPSVPSC